MHSIEELLDASARISAGKSGPLVVALDGRSGAGKSSLAAQIAPRLGAVVIESDDFFSGGSDAEWLSRTAEQRVAGCINWRRLRDDALIPLLAGRAAEWRSFDFASGSGLADRTIRREPANVIILDGVYSARPELSDLVGFSVLVEVPDEQLRRQRLIAREGPEFIHAWHSVWDDAEEYYFSNIRTRDSFDLIAEG